MPYLTPDTPPDELICRVLYIPNDPFWLSLVDGALSELTREFRFQAYGDYTPEQTAERFTEMYDAFVSQSCEDIMTGCCYDVVRHRVTSTGAMEISINGGDWIPDPNDPRVSGISLPPPTMDESHTKCDAATNGRQHFQDYIEQVSSEISGTSSVYVLALALAALIVALFFGQVEAIPPIVAFIIAVIPSLIDLGQAAWDAYWTSDNLDIILCALYCNMGDDGQLTAGQFSAFITYLQEHLPASVAADALINQINAIGLVGVNNMCAYGSSADADCSSCDCSPCTLLSFWSKGLWASGALSNNDGSGVMVETGDCYMIIDSHDRGDGNQAVYVVTTDDNSSHCASFGVTIVSGTQNEDRVGIACGSDRTYTNFSTLGGDPNNLNAFGLLSTLPFRVRLDFGTP